MGIGHVALALGAARAAPRLNVGWLVLAALLSDFLPVQLARSFGMRALQEIGPLRRFVMRQAIAPGSFNTHH